MVDSTTKGSWTDRLTKLAKVNNLNITRPGNLVDATPLIQALGEKGVSLSELVSK